MSFADRFEVLDPLREGILQDEQVQTLRARERATGRAVEVHLSASADSLAKLESQSVIDRGTHEGKFYVVTMPLSLDSVGAWRINPRSEPPERQPPGDFTRMFELRQAPEPVAAPAAKPVESPAPAPAPPPGEFTRAFKRPAAAPSAAPAGPASPGQPGEFTRMFQKPVPAPPMPASQLKVRSRTRMGLIMTAILIIFAIAVFVVVRTLY